MSNVAVDFGLPVRDRQHLTIDQAFGPGNN
jgi:hypothetical protein